MNELITLSPTEQFLANTNMTMTLKDVADRYNKENSNLMRDFKRMVVSLDDDEINALKFEGVNYKDKKGEIRPTFTLDLKTMLWFMTKFDHSLRLKVINFAFEKLEQEKDLAITEARKPIVYDDGRMSVRRCIAEAWSDEEDAPMESEIWNSLIWAGFARTKAKVTTTKVIPEKMEGVVGAMRNRGFATYHPSVVRETWTKYEDADKPIVSEYDRLQREFKEISDYYEMKLSEASKV